MQRQNVAPDRPVFVSNRGQALTRYGIYKIVRRHVHQLETGDRAQRRHISPHCFRHTAAVHLLESGVDVNVIRGWLGHVSLETTNRYAEINIRTKEAALRCCEPKFGPDKTYRGARVWRDNQSVLDWLESL